MFTPAILDPLHMKEHLFERKLHEKQSMIIKE
jgi:hypothetical protein